jgi:hypothetical protein
VVPTFEIADYPITNAHRVRTERLSVIDRVLDATSMEIRTIEEERLLTLFEAAISYNSERNINTNTQTLNDLHTLHSGFSLIEQNDLRVGNIFMNAADYSYLRDFSDARNHLDVETHREMILAGRLGTLWGTQINVSANVPHGRIYLSSEPTFTGVMPLRTDITVVSADSPPNIGWSVFEQTGMAVLNPNAVASITTNDFEGNREAGAQDRVRINGLWQSAMANVPETL